MNGPIVTQCPTLTNPDAITDIAELRRALHDANEQLLAAASELHETKAVLQAMGGSLTSIVMPYMEGKPDQLIAALDEFVAAHVRVREATSNGRTH